MPRPALVPSVCWGQVSFPARAEPAGQDGQGQEEMSHGQGSRAPAKGCGVHHFLHGALHAHSSHVQPGARTTRGAQHCPAPSHPPGTAATAGPEQLPLSTGASPQLREPGPTPAAAPRSLTADLHATAPLRAGPDASSHRLCLKNSPACHGAPGNWSLPAWPAAWPACPQPGPHGSPTQPASC